MNISRLLCVPGDAKLIGSAYGINSEYAHTCFSLYWVPNKGYILDAHIDDYEREHIEAWHDDDYYSQLAWLFSCEKNVCEQFPCGYFASLAEVDSFMQDYCADILGKFGDETVTIGKNVYDVSPEHLAQYLMVDKRSLVEALTEAKNYILDFANADVEKDILRHGPMLMEFIEYLLDDELILINLDIVEESTWEHEDD